MLLHRTGDWFAWIDDPGRQRVEFAWGRRCLALVFAAEPLVAESIRKFSPKIHAWIESGDPELKKQAGKEFIAVGNLFCKTGTLRQQPLVYSQDPQWYSQLADTPGRYHGAAYGAQSEGWRENYPLIYGRTSKFSYLGAGTVPRYAEPQPPHQSVWGRFLDSHGYVVPFDAHQAYPSPRDVIESQELEELCGLEAAISQDPENLQHQRVLNAQVWVLKAIDCLGPTQLSPLACFLADSAACACTRALEFLPRSPLSPKRKLQAETTREKLLLSIRDEVLAFYTQALDPLEGGLALLRDEAEKANGDPEKFKKFRDTWVELELPDRQVVEDWYAFHTGGVP